MVRIIKMIVALWPFYIVAGVVIVFFMAIFGVPGAGSKPASPAAAQHVKPATTETVLTPPEALKKLKIAFKLGDIVEANRVFKLIPEGTPEHKEAQQLYADRKVTKAREEKETAQAAKKAAIANRKLFAKNYEQQLLSKGMDVYATVHGKENTTLKIKWILVSRPLVHKMINEGGTVDNLKNMGFTKLVMTDGYDDTWNIDLRPGK